MHKTVDVLDKLPNRLHREAIKKLIFDMDSSVSQIHSQQEDSAINDYFDCTRHHLPQNTPAT